MSRSVLEIPMESSPPPPGPERRDSLRHIKIKVKKSWLAVAAWSVLVTVGGWIATSIPYVWSWEKHQVTDSQLGHVLYDAIDRDTGKPAPAAIFDEATLPPEGVIKRLLALEEQNRSLSSAVASAKGEVQALRLLIVDQYRWRVRTQAASSEPDARKRKDSADRSEAKFNRAVEAGKPLDEAYRLALERNPYQ
jgi:hypothetical protein